MEGGRIIFARFSPVAMQGKCVKDTKPRIESMRCGLHKRLDRCASCRESVVGLNDHPDDQICTPVRLGMSTLYQYKLALKLFCRWLLTFCSVRLLFLVRYFFVPVFTQRFLLEECINSSAQTHVLWVGGARYSTPRIHRSRRHGRRL